MNKQLLASVLAKNGDTQSDLAKVLGLSLSRTNAKINETQMVLSLHKMRLQQSKRRMP